MENELNNYHDIKKLIKLYSFINDKHSVEQLESMLSSAERAAQSTKDISETYKNLIRSNNFSRFIESYVITTTISFHL